MKKLIRHTAGIGLALLALSPRVRAADAPAAPISTTVTDANNKDWKEYDNRIVKVHLRINVAWTLMEFKETKDSGSIGLTFSRTPLATFAAARNPLGGTFDEWVSSPSLTSLYPSGFKKSPAVFAGRKGFLVKGTAKDGRLEETYFLSQGGYVDQVTFAAPEDDWARFQPVFSELQRSFRWLK